MAIGAQLSPVARQRAFTALGVVAPGALWYSFAAGTTTPQATYNDSALTTPNAQPLVADSGGLFGPVYLAFGQEYRFQWKTSAGVLIWDQDNVPGDTSTAVTSTISGTQANVVLTPGATLLRLNNATLLTISGLAAGYDGQLLTLVSVGAGQVDLLPQDAGSAAPNRLINIATMGATSLAAGTGTANYQYDATAARWRLLSHEQGRWINGSSAGASYTGSGTIVWTVDPITDISSYAFYLKGSALTVEWALTTTSVSGTGTALQIAIPNGYQARVGVGGVGVVFDNGGPQVAGSVLAGAGLTYIRHYRDLTETANWSASTNLTGMRGSLAFEVI